MRRRYFTLGKDAGQANDDVVAACRARNIFALADGASACYDGRGWAKMLARHYARNGSLSLPGLEAARLAYRAEAAPPASDWLGVIAFDRGSFSTLLGFQIGLDAISGFALGDSVLFVQAGDEITVIPPLKPGDFHLNPVLLASHHGIGAFSDTPEALAAACFSVPAPAQGWGGCRLLAMTDGVAAWTLADDDGLRTRLELLDGLPDWSSFARLVLTEIEASRMRHDDATVVILNL